MSFSFSSQFCFLNKNSFFWFCAKKKEIRKYSFLVESSLEYFELVEKTKGRMGKREEREEAVREFVDLIGKGGKEELKERTKMIVSVCRIYRIGGDLTEFELGKFDKRGKMRKAKEMPQLSSREDLEGKINEALERHLKWQEKFEELVEEKKLNMRECETRRFLVGDYIRLMCLTKSSLPSSLTPSLGVSFIIRTHMCSPFSFSDLTEEHSLSFEFSEETEKRVIEKGAEFAKTDEEFESTYGHKMEGMFSVKGEDLPEQKGLRSTILKMIMSKMSGGETLEMSLVSKEWYKLSRSEAVWRSHLERDLKEWKEKYPLYEFLQAPLPPQKSFMVYWKLKNDIQIRLCLEKGPQKKWRKCGIGVSMRGSVDQKEEEKKEEKGCCHGEVEKISEELFGKQTVKSLVSMKMSEEEFERKKEEVNRELSLKCMERAMTDEEIRGELILFIHNNLFLKIK